MQTITITTHIGHWAYEQYLGPIMDDEAERTQIWVDAEHDMSREAQTDPRKRWWIAIDGNDNVLAWCAAWTSHDATIICGENYEHHWGEREQRFWPIVFTARQRWLQQQAIPAVTWIFDQPAPLHEAAGWTRTGDEGISGHRHHWQQLTWTP